MHIESVKMTGTKDKPALQIALYKTPLPYELLYEIDDRVGKQLFRREGKDNYVPVAELDDVTLKIGELPAFNLAVYPHDADGADGAGQLITGVRVTKIEATKLFADKPDWTLICHAVLPMDSHTLELMRAYYKKTCFVSFEASQTELELETDDKKPIILDDATVESGQVIQCQVCEERATFLGMDQSAFCDAHVRSAIGVQVRRIHYVGDAA